MANEEIGVLKRRYVLFSCEGTAEGMVIQTLYDNDLMVVPRSRVVMDAVWDDRPYTRLRKASAIAGQYFGVDYAVDGPRALQLRASLTAVLQSSSCPGASKTARRSLVL